MFNFHGLGGKSGSGVDESQKRSLTVFYQPEVLSDVTSGLCCKENMLFFLYIQTLFFRPVLGSQQD